MTMSLEQLQKAQAEADGFAFGPLPALNPANLNTQDSIGNPQVPTISPVPYYPSDETPFLHLTTDDMSSALANNFVLIDTKIASLGAAAWATLVGDLTRTQVIPFDGPIVGTPDTGISRIGVDSLAIGNGVFGNASGSLTLSNIFSSVVDTASLILTGPLTDSFGSVGTLGQILESTVTGVKWIASSASGFIYTVISKSANYTANSGDDVWCTGTFTVTLPSPTNITRVKVSNRGTGMITVAGAINGNSSLIIARQYDSAEFASDGTTWDIE